MPLNELIFLKFDDFIGGLIKRFIFVLLVIISIITVLMLRFLYHQGGEDSEIYRIGSTQVRYDSKGIPTIVAKNWHEAIRAQGYVVASQRMFQMDLLRRASLGRLSELLGNELVHEDLKKWLQRWPDILDHAVQELPIEQKLYCDIFAAGVNEFILKYENMWGFEYALLRERPAPWSCRDSLAVGLYMVDVLSSSAEHEWEQWRWSQSLDKAWRTFLYPNHHPWAEPIFKELDKAQPDLPKHLFNELPSLPYIRIDQFYQKIKGRMFFESPLSVGSNAWVFASGDQVLLSVDPHLPQSVPQLWFAMRFIIKDSDLKLSGVSLPGLWGVIIGQNNHVAWAFTNLPEDIDDYIEEEIDWSTKRYVAQKKGARKYWQDLNVKDFYLKIKGEEDQLVHSYATHRGPLVIKEIGGEKKYFSRHWLGLRPQFLASLPFVQINSAQSANELIKAMRQIFIPPQAVVFADAEGHIGVMATGVGIKRQNPGDVPVLASQHQPWKIIKTEKRPLKLSEPSSEQLSRFFVVANAQLYESQFPQRWASDDRRRRITERLKQISNSSISLEIKMKQIQLDNHDEFLRELLQWVMKHSHKHLETNFPEMALRWQAWSGSLGSDVKTFTDAKAIEKIIANYVLARVKEAYEHSLESEGVYKSFLRRAWMWYLMQDDQLWQKLGVSPYRLCAFVVDLIGQERWSLDGKTGINLEDYPKRNLFQAQHIFVNRIPVLGRLFRVRSFIQYGHPFAPNATQPFFGPSFRAIFNLRDQHKSQWTFPVGQSGHVRSLHYRNWQKLWIKNKYLPVF